MLDKILVVLSAWFLLSLMVGLLLGRTISMLRRAPTLNFVSSEETDWQPGAFDEQQMAEMLALSSAQTQDIG